MTLIIYANMGVHGAFSLLPGKFHLVLLDAVPISGPAVFSTLEHLA